MSYAHKVVRVTFSGTAFGGAEIWSSGLFLGFEGADAAEVTAPMPAQIFEHWKLLFTPAVNGKIANSWSTTQVKMAALDTDGDTILDQVEYHDATPALAGNNVQTSFPPQITLAATFKSSNVRGLAAKGRMFLPGVQTPMTSGGKAHPDHVDQLAQQVADFLSAVNGDIGMPGKVINASFGAVVLKDETGKPVEWGPGQNKLVEWVQLGDVYDTQRRRRNALIEQYTTKNVAD